MLGARRAGGGFGLPGLLPRYLKDSHGNPPFNISNVLECKGVSGAGHPPSLFPELPDRVSVARNCIDKGCTTPGLLSSFWCRPAGLFSTIL